MTVSPICNDAVVVLALFDDDGVAECFFKLLDAPFYKALPLFGVVVVRVFLEVSLGNGLFELLREFDTSHIDEFIKFTLE